MQRRPRTRTRRRRSRRRSALLLALLVTAAAGTCIAVDRRGTPPGLASTVFPALANDDGQLGVAGGELGDGTSASQLGRPGVARLDPLLRAAVQAAERQAHEAGIELLVTSGWRSPAYQERLLREAVVTYGSEVEAARWVASAETSAHVSGDAVDVGSWDAAAWLAQHGAPHGLCPVYDNEPWHFELRSDAVDHGCPGTYPDPTHDPRMQP